MRALRVACILAAASSVFGECRRIGTTDGSVVNIECQHAGRLSPERILVEYLKRNPEPALMVVRVFGNRETAMEYRRLLFYDMDYVRFWFKNELNFSRPQVEVTEAVLFQGVITTRTRSGTEVRTVQRRWSAPAKGCRLPVTALFPLAHTAIREMGQSYYRSKGPIRTAVDLYKVSPRPLPADQYGKWVKTLSACMPLASVEVHVRRDPFFVDQSEYPALNPFFYGAPISEASIRSTPTISCRIVPGTPTVRCFEYFFEGVGVDEVEVKR